MRGFLACAPSLGTLLWVQVPLLTRHPGGDRSSDPAGTVAGIAAADTGSGLQQTQLRIPTWRSAVQSMQQVVDWLRAIKLTQCKRGTTMYQDLIAMGASLCMCVELQQTSGYGGATARSPSMVS